MKKYLVDDSEYSVRAVGDGGPILIFAHGFPFDGSIFDASLEKLSQNFFCVVPDLRGFGESTLGANGRNPQGKPRVTMGRYADDLTILASEIACERGDDRNNAKIFFCGLSMGGYIGLALARRRPERLAGLIFCDSNASADSEEKANARRELADSVDSARLRVVANDSVAQLLSPKTIASRPDVGDALRRTIERQRPAAVAAASRGMSFRPDSTDLLPTLKIPTLVLGGADDRLSTPQALDALAAAVPKAARATIPDAGHLPPLENPDAFADAILSWYKKEFNVENQ